MKHDYWLLTLGFTLGLVNLSLNWITLTWQPTSYSYTSLNTEVIWYIAVELFNIFVFISSQEVISFYLP